jgi:hypothetical protein
VLALSQTTRGSQRVCWRVCSPASSTRFSQLGRVTTAGSTSWSRGRLQPPAGPSESDARPTDSLQALTVTDSDDDYETRAPADAQQDDQGQGPVGQPRPRQPRA